MAGGIGILRAEGRSEGVNIAERQRENLRLQLSGYGQAGLFAKKVLAVVDLAVLGSRQIFEIQRRYLKHLAGTLCVAGSNLRGMHIDEVLILKEFVNRVGYQRTDAEHRAEHVRSRTQITDLS